MDPRRLLEALMERDRETPTSLAAKLGDRTKQPVVWRFLKGESREPRRSTLEPVADHFGVPVDAFYDPEKADIVFHEKGLARYIELKTAEP